MTTNQVIRSYNLLSHPINGLLGTLQRGEVERRRKEECTNDGTVDFYGMPANRGKTGKWLAGIMLLLNQVCFSCIFGVRVNLVLFLTRVLQQDNAEAANNIQKLCNFPGHLCNWISTTISGSAQLYLIKPKGCGDRTTLCGEHSNMEISLFYISVYMIALGYGGYQPNIATFGADQFDENYFEDKGMWALGFWTSAGSAFAALVLFLGGTAKYRHFRCSGNPITRFSQRKMLHTAGFRFLDRAALITSKEHDNEKQSNRNPWSLCPVSKVEEVKCILRLLPIWLCTIVYSVVFTQMASIFVEQGDAMKTTMGKFRIPAAIKKFKKSKGEAQGITQLQRMGIGLVIAVMAMLSAAIIECYRLKYARKDCTRCEGSSSLSILWQIPQYSLVGASEVFMYVGQLEFFRQAPDGLKSRKCTVHDIDITRKLREQLTSEHSDENFNN
ncbi:hypothetical protein HAX54_014105 [Datura stramonium]|uniref:Uncharacterized protein n=1 Tax=Datura stramonium TaxID=4076 RepID=A0ABS8S0K7_DATST|nr:hypothetical protein [Datura stramonium]